MIRSKIISIVSLCAIIVLWHSSEALALGGINVTPFGWDFGDVVIGESAVQTFRVEHVSEEYPSEIWFYLAEIEDDVTDTEPPSKDDLSAFNFTWGTSSEVGRPPLTVDSGGFRLIGPVILNEEFERWVEFEISFTPSYVGFHDARLEILSNAIFPDLYLDLSGNGSDINPVPEPCTMLLVGSGLMGLVGIRRRLGKIQLL